KGKGHLELQEVPEPVIEEDGVKIKVKACGICSTDLLIYHDRIDYRAPVILGHEISGIVVEVGSRVKGIKVGDRVAADSHGYYCNTCGFCQRGLPRYCLERTMVGRDVNGGFAEYFATKASYITVLGDRIDLVSGAMTQPLFKTTHCLIEHCGIKAGTKVVVLGSESTSLLALMIAKAAGATVYLVDFFETDQHKLARELGADEIMLIDQGGVKEQVMDLTGGLGVACVIECSGQKEGVALGVKLLEKTGRLLLQSHGYAETPVDLKYIVANGIEIIGASGTTWTAKQKALELMSSQKIQVRKLVSRVLPLTSWEEGFALMEENASASIILDPSRSDDNN
ncbi:MAG TPA: alcohol dehydrogenase catalytic domain-containing protein, partial [Clostridia bacterium]|nr:alcohol dehydrogenase catalytic domain-containing protein [Clostridia bacterium]